ncbi:2-oxo-4-hydroxy-4-carboxy-5-ureidoimidazoline decarboxylase [Propylenella binzhouense]|uniref:2-oxo-4-hydroxy-4-carboxy-5-ureidoimidazoline decarboxylase n=1 Tax=Propylenella binzhouense TaxID=2555902 RepID=A0A964T5F3_9HYPH|nr:2-oxo-4-hydroxy-4-carboxy-5-ureidoimidazoline decarboxylase [Propylenella binzhouense]
MSATIPDPRPSALGREAFVARFGGIYEHSPWVAEAVWDAGLGTDLDDPERLAAAMARVVATASPERKRALVRAHPDLAGRAAIAGELTASSRAEQKGAGLDACTPEEFRRFQALNAAYKAKFGFPFVIAVGGLGREEILAAFERRIGNDPDTEFGEALRQIDRIAAIRLAAMSRPAA